MHLWVTRCDRSTDWLWCIITLRPGQLSRLNNIVRIAPYANCLIQHLTMTSFRGRFNKITLIISYMRRCMSTYIFYVNSLGVKIKIVLRFTTWRCVSWKPFSSRFWLYFDFRWFSSLTFFMICVDQSATGKRKEQPKIIKKRREPVELIQTILFVNISFEAFVYFLIYWQYNHRNVVAETCGLAVNPLRNFIVPGVFCDGMS